MLRHRRLLDPQLHDDVSHGTFLEREITQNLASAGFGDSVERIGRGSGSCHELFYIFRYRNMSSDFLAVALGNGETAGSRSCCNRPNYTNNFAWIAAKVVVNCLFSSLTAEGSGTDVTLTLHWWE